jgi:citrate synthase
MLFNMSDAKYRPDPVFERALGVLFILHADHEQNGSASTMRNIGSSKADPEQRIARPRQIYLGPDQRDYVSIEER